jgi:hypothetical protein
VLTSGIAGALRASSVPPGSARRLPPRPRSCRRHGRVGVTTGPGSDSLVLVAVQSDPRRDLCGPGAETARLATPPGRRWTVASCRVCDRPDRDVEPPACHRGEGCWGRGLPVQGRRPERHIDCVRQVVTAPQLGASMSLYRVCPVGQTEPPADHDRQPRPGSSGGATPQIATLLSIRVVIPVEHSLALCAGEATRGEPRPSGSAVTRARSCTGDQDDGLRLVAVDEPRRCGGIARIGDFELDGAGAGRCGGSRPTPRSSSKPTR